MSDAVRIVLNADADATAEDIDTMTTSLRSDLLELDLHSVDRASGNDLPPGAKSGVAEVAGVLVASGVLSAATVKAVASVATAWLKRSTARSVTIHRGKDSIEITGTSQQQLDALVDQWFSRHDDAD